MSCCTGVGELVKQSFKCCCRARSIVTVIDHCTSVIGPSHSFAPCCWMHIAVSLEAYKVGTKAAVSLSATERSHQTGSQRGSS